MLYPQTESASSRVLLLIFIAGLGLAGLALLAGSSLPFDWVKSLIDAQAPDGRTERFQAALFGQIVFRLRLAGGLLLVLGASLLAGRRRLGQGLDRLIRSLGLDLPLFRSGLVEDLRGALRRSGGLHLLVLLLLTGAAVWLRLEHLDRPIRHDEALTFLKFAAKPFWILVSDYDQPNNHLLHTGLVRLSYLLFGDAPWAIRLPAFLAGVFLVPAAYCLGRRLYNRRAGLLAAALAAPSSALVDYSTNARGYSLVGLLFVLCLLLADWLRERPNAAGWLLLGLLMALGLVTVPVMLYPAGTVAVWLALEALLAGHDRRSPELRGLGLALGLAALLTLALYLPALVVSGPWALLGNQYVQPRGWGDFLGRLPALAYSVSGLWFRDAPGRVVLLLELGFLISLVFHRRLAGHRLPLIAAAALWCGPVLLLQRVVPYPRVFVIFLPLYLVLAAAGVGHLLDRLVGGAARRRDLAAAGLALVLAAVLAHGLLTGRAMYLSEDTGTLREGREITRFLAQRLGPEDRVLATGVSVWPLEYHFRRQGLKREFLDRPVAASPRLFVVVHLTCAPRQSVKAILAEHRAGPAEFGPPELIQRYRFAEIYEVKRRDRAG